MSAHHIKRLVIMRHAKSDWSGEGVADHDRPLNRRGKQARRLIADAGLEGELRHA